jgi:acyl transferase domain-containing protein
MDPQQRILLHVAYEALEDAGYTPGTTPTFSRDTFGCYIGAATHDYVHNLGQNIDVYYAPGISISAWNSAPIASDAVFRNFGGFSERPIIVLLRTEWSIYGR